MTDRPASMFRPRRLGHVNLFVDNLERSTRFYHDVCGLAVEFTEVELKANFLGTGNTPHDVGMIETTKGEDRYGRDGHLQIPKEIGARVMLNHIAWEVENEVELVAGYERAKRAGVRIGRTSDHQIARSIYMPDPDGNIVEFYVDTVRDWRRVLHGPVDLVTSQWTPGTPAPSPEPRYETDPAIRHVAHAPLHPTRLTHVVLQTHDVARLSAFYRDVGGLRPTGGTADGRLALLRGSRDDYRYHLAIVAAAPGATPGMHHFTLEVADPQALDAAERLIEAQGFTVEARTDTESKRSVFLVDPDGFRVEFAVPRSAGLAHVANAPPEALPYQI